MPGDQYTGPHSRAYDRSTVWRIARFWSKWSWLAAPLTALFIAAGFGFSTPNSRFTQLDHKITAVNVRVDTLKQQVNEWHDAGLQDRKDMRQILEFLARSRCVQMSQHDKNVLGGNDVCDAVQHPLDHAIKAHIRAPDESY